MSKNPFQKYLEATDRQNTNYSYLRAGTPSLGAEYADTTLQPQYTDKTLNDYIGDTAVDATKAAMTLAQTGISTIDAGAYAAEGLIGMARGIGSTVAPNYVAPPDIQEYGQFSKLLDDYAGINIGKAKQTLGELGYSDIRKKQEAELHTGYSEKEIQDFKDQWASQFYLQYQDLANKGANPLELEAFKAKFEDNYKQAYTQMMDKYQTSWDKSFGENAAIVGKAFGTVLDNPALAAGAAIESTGYLLPSLAVSRGVAALQKAQGLNAAQAGNRAIAAGIGEGLVSALALNEQMRGNSATGTIDGTKVAAGFGGGALTALIGGVSNKLGSRFGLDDIDSLVLGTQAKGFSVTRPLLATVQEGGEEFLQGFGESIIPNIAEGKDPLQGLAQELALGTAAGGVMGAATNARSLVSGAGSDLLAGFNKVAEAVGKGKDAITAKTFEEFNDPSHKAYDPAKAFNSQVPDLSSADETVRTKAQENMDSIFEGLEKRMTDLRTEARKHEISLEKYNALSEEDRKLPNLVKEKQDAEKELKKLKETIVKTDNQYGDLYLQKIALEKNQEVQAGIPQYSEEQAKADIEVLSQAPASTAVWATEDNDGNALNIPVTITGTPVVSNGYETVEVKYTDSTGKERTTYAPTSELVQDTTTQQQAAQRITKHFSKLSLDELDTVAKSPYLSEEQRNSLRYLSEAKRAIADLASPTDVTNHIMNGLKGKTPMESHRGLNTYTDMVNTAINTKDEKLLNLALNDLGRFAQDHTDKANALVEANQLVKSGQFPKVQVLRSNDGTWGIVTDPNKFVDDIKLKATAGWNVTVHSNKKGAIDLVTKEATLIQDNLKALTQVGLSFGLQAVEPTVTPPVTVEALREANKPVVPSNNTDGITSAIARLNKYNKSSTPLTIDNVTPEALQTIQAKVSSAFELDVVNQQTYDGVTKDIATLQQYLSSAKPNRQNQEVSKTNTTTQPSTKPNTQDISNITDNQKTGIWEESQLSNLKRVIDSFVTINEITPEEYRQGKGSVYERAWALVKTAYSSTTKHITELMAKGITTVEDIENLTQQLNKLYGYANQSIDIHSDRASLDRLTLNINSLATVLFSDVDSKLIDEYLKQKEEKVARRGDKLLTDRDGNKSFDGRTTEYVFNAPHLQNNKPSSANAVNNTPKQGQVPSTEPTASVATEPTKDTTQAVGAVKQWGYLGELLEDEDVEKVVKDVIEKVLEDEADKSKRQRPSSYARFVELFTSHGFIEYFTKQAKNDPSIIKLTKDFNKLRDLARMPKHLKVLEDYVDSQNNDDLRAYLNKYPELKSIFSELKVKNPAKGTRGLALDVIADLRRVKNLLRTELGKLVQLVGLMYIQAAFTKGQQYLIDTNYADLNSVIFPNTLSLLSTNNIGYLNRDKVLGDDSVSLRKSLTPTELAFLDKVDGVPVGELPKEAFEIVKALVQNAVNTAFNSYEVVNYPRDEAKISSDIVHNIIVEHLPKEGFTIENHTPEEVINGAVPTSFIWSFTKQKSSQAEEAPVTQDSSPVVNTVNTTLQNQNQDIPVVNKDSLANPVTELLKANLEPTEFLVKAKELGIVGVALEVAKDIYNRTKAKVSITKAVKENKAILQQIEDTKQDLRLYHFGLRGIKINITTDEGVFEDAYVSELSRTKNGEIDYKFQVESDYTGFKPNPVLKAELEQQLIDLPKQLKPLGKPNKYFKDYFDIETKAEPEVKSTEATPPVTTSAQNTTDIYSKLPPKSISGNVVQQSWGKLKTATKAVYDKAIISTRIPNTDEHFGNPFSSDSKVLANNPTLIKTNSTKESVEKYIDWVLNSKDARAKWIREQLKSGNLKGKQILYYTELNEPSHATALDYLINKYDWNTESPSKLAKEQAELARLKGLLAPQPVSPRGGVIPRVHLDRISRGLKDGKTVEEIATKIQKSLPHLTIEDVTQQVLAEQEKASKPATLDSIIGKYLEDEEVDEEIRQSAEVLKKFLPETIGDWKIDNDTFATRGAWRVSYTKPFIQINRETGKEVVSSTTTAAPLDIDILLSGDEQAIKNHIKERLTKNNITPKGVKNWRLDDTVSPTGQQVVDSTQQQNVMPAGKANASTSFDVLIPIGTSGSGKSTFIKSLPQENLVIIEPDAMRVEFTGDINDKSKDSEIYAEAANRAIKAIQEGKQVVFDTTNLTKEKRLPFIEAIKKEIPTANIQYKLMPLNPELAKQRIKADIAAGKNRANVPDATIDRHAESYKQMLEDIKTEPMTPYNGVSNQAPQQQLDAVNTKATQSNGNSKPSSTQTSDDAEALIEALKTEAEKRVTLEDEDTLESEALSELVSLAYGNAITKEDLETVKQLFGEDLVNEAIRIRSLPLGKKHEAQSYLDQLRLVFGSHFKVKMYVEDVTLEELATYKEAVLGLMKKRKQDTTNASKIFDVLTAYVTQNQAAIAQPETKVESDEAIQANQSVENKDENKDKTQTEEAATAEGITQFKFKGNTHTLATRLIDQWHKAQDVFEDMLKVTSSNLTPSHVSVLTDRLKALIPVQPETRIRFVNVVDSGEGVPESILTKGGNTRIDINGIPIILVNLHNPVPEMDLLETTTHEYVHAVTSKWLIENPKSIEAQRLQQVIDALGEYLKTTEGLDAETIKRATQAQKNIREVIAFGLTNEKVMNVIDALLIEDMQNDTFEQSNEGTREQAVGGGRGVLEASEAREESSNIGRRGHSEKSTEKSSKTGRQVLEEVLQVIVESTLSKENQAEVEDGKITVLQGVTEAVRQEERSKPFSVRNLIKAYFTQKKADASNSPLVLVKDFISNLNVASDLSKYLSIDTKVNTKQKAQVEHFQKFAKNLAPVITRVFQGEFSKDPKNNLVRDLAIDGVLDENILTAIAVAAYGYLIRYSEPYNTDDNIRDIVRITKDDAIPPQVAQLLRYAGQEAPYVESDLGKEIAKLLGLKALDDSSADLQSRLEKALGSLTTAALNDVGYVSVDSTSISPKAIGYLMRNAGFTGNAATGIDDGLEGTENLHSLETVLKLTFIRVNYQVDDKAPVIAIDKAAKIDPVKVLRPARNKDGLIIIKPLVWGTDLNKTSPNDLNDILKNSEETKGILDKVFNNDVGYIKPLLVEPEALDVTTKQGTNNSISKTQKELVEKGQKTAFSIRANTVNVLRTLKGRTDDSKFLKQLLGIWVDDDVLARTHVTDRESLEAKAKNEWRILTNGLEWADYTSLGNDEYAEFYDAQYITQNERMQYLAKLFNMQASQIHRAMASLSAFKLEIDLTDTSSANENLQRFYQAVGEGLEGLDDYLAADIKSKSKWYQFFTTDKVKGEVYTEALKAFLQTEKAQDAIGAMVDLMEDGVISGEHEKRIAWFVEKGGMGIQSLQSLIALAELDNAQFNGTTFTTTIGLGSDGVNNGVATANILTGVITREMKQQVGMLPEKPTKYDPVPFKNMQEVYAEGMPDYYISFGAVMGRFLGLLRTKDTANNKQWRDSVQALFPLYKAIQEASIEMRKIAKTWSIPFNYGAGKKSLQRALARGFMAGIYKDMNKIANKAIDLNTALAEKDITKEVFDVEMAALRLTAATLQENINNILKRGWSETIDKDNKTTWKTTYRIQFPKDLTKLNDYNFDEAQVGQVYFDREGNRQVSFDSAVATNVSEGIVYSLTQAVTALHGKAAWQATEEYAQEYTKVRDLLNTVHTATYMLYENMRTDLIQAKLREKREKVIGTIEKRNAEMEASNNALINEYKLKGKEAVRNAQADPRWQVTTPVKDLVKEFEYLGLTTEELREVDNILKPVAPVLHSALSRETNDLNAGITLTETNDKVAKASDNKQVATSYIDKYKGKPRYNTSGLSFKVQMASGIKALAMAVQGVDAYVAAYLQAKFPTLNVHDAGIFGLKYFVEATKYQNEIYLQAMVNYHLNTESVEALMRSYLGLKDFIASLDGLGLDEIAKAKFIKQVEIVEDNILNRVAERNPDGTVKTRRNVDENGDTYDEEIRKGIFKGLNKTLKTFGVLPKDTIIEALQALIVQAIQQDMSKLKSLKDLKSVHQYSGDGGAFIIGGKGSDLSAAEHLRRIEAQEELLKLKERTLLQQLEREGVALDLVLGKKTRGSSLLNFLTTNKDKEVDVKDIVTILRGDSSLTRSTAEFNRQLAILDSLDGLLDGVKVIYKDVESTDGITDNVRGYYDSDTNTITLRANAKYPANPVLVLHELLHSGLAARLETLRQVPKTNEKDYILARKALDRLEALRQEVLSKLVEGVDASKYFELKAAFEKAGGWEAYKEVQKKLKEARDSAYAARNIRIKTLKELRLKAYEELNAQKAELQAAKNLEQEALDGLRAFEFNSLEYQTARLQQQAALAAIKEIKQELQQKYENIANINTQLDKHYAGNLTDELNSGDIAKVALGREFLTLHSTLKNTMFTIEGGIEITALTMVERLESVDEFISYGLTEESVQDILQNIDVVNTEERKQVSALRGMWGKFVKAVSALFVRPSAEVVPALSAFILDTADLLRSIRNEDVPRLPVESTTRLFSTSADDQVNQMGSVEVMQSLPHTGNTDFGLHLNRLAETVIGQLYNNDEVAKAQIDVIQAIQVAPAIKAGFNLSQREAAVQRSLELVLETYMLNTAGGANASQLWKIYKEAQKNIKVETLYDGDWSTATAQERAATHQKFKYLFADNLKGTEALARFVSMALASEEVHSLLGFNTVTAKPSKQKSWFDTVNAWAQYVFAWMGNKLVRTSANDPAYKQLQKLVNNLVALDIRNRQDTVALYEKAWNLVGKVTEPLDKAAQSLRQYATNRDFLRNSKYLPLRTLGSIAALDAKAMGETIPKLIRETRDKARPNEKLGEAMNALMESTAMTQIRKAMEALIRQANLNAKERQDRTDNVKKAIMSWFKDGGKHITKAVHKAITYTLLRTDAQSLLTTFGLNKTIGLLLDTNKLKNEIDLVTKDISQYPNGVDMIHAAEDLGYYMISNKGGMGLSKNPTAIAAGIGTNYQIPLEDVDQALVGQLDVLVSLFAMKYTSAKDRKVLGEMYKENPEALEGLLQMHKGFMTDAATEFKDNPLNYVKGWMPEIVNPYREVRAASSTAERDQMIKEGWKLIEEIKPHGKFLMIHPDIGYQRLVSGAVDLQNSHRKGTEIIDRQSKQYLAAVKANLAYTAHRASIPLGQYDPTKKPTGLIPAYDTDGVPMGFNYEMASWVRDKEMERNNNFADLMGAYAGAMFYKPAKRNQSVTVANVLFEDYKQNYQKNPNSYIKLSGKSSDPKIVEMWRMLPKDFRQRATELYGKGEPIIINNEAFLLAFGFKKWTITSIWDKPVDQRTKMETMFVTMAEGLLRDTAKARIAKGGHIWAEVVSKAKDFIVIRSIDVLWNNVLANGLMLMAYGINPFTIAKDWAFITANVRSYQKLNSELIQLKANTLAGKGNDATERQINAIQKQLEANPISKYINEGLLSSIVEDVTIQQGDYSYDSELKKKIDGVTGWLPDSVKTIGAWAVLSPSTQGYQFLATTTQLSDFVAKVTLAKHLESKGMDFKAAVSEASQTFINYDVPQGVGMQYMNDMGLFMFTKFFLRIQAVLFKLMDKKAATVLAQHIAVESLTDMQGILDPMALARIGNWPFEEGAASIIGAAMSIAPVNAGLGLVGM